MAFDTFKMRAALVTEVVEHYRCRSGYLPAYRRFAVKYTHGIAVKTLFAGVAKLVLPALKITFKRFVVLLTAGGAAY